ncbi:hypothetical protein [Mycolicibacterium sp. PDY-3]|uniref:hypothetical protein n=1 Tax=Mycolicibacterium sp. PDY-3 TaxID=3376069 RepID=UPI0037ACE6FA
MVLSPLSLTAGVRRGVLSGSGGADADEPSEITGELAAAGCGVAVDSFEVPVGLFSSTMVTASATVSSGMTSSEPVSSAVASSSSRPEPRVGSPSPQLSSESSDCSASSLARVPELSSESSGAEPTVSRDDPPLPFTGPAVVDPASEDDEESELSEEPVRVVPEGASGESAAAMAAPPSIAAPIPRVIAPAPSHSRACWARRSPTQSGCASCVPSTVIDCSPLLV